MKQALLALALVACAHAQQPAKVDFQDPMVIRAGPPGDLPIGELDDSTLFDIGTRAFEGGDFAKAAQHFDRLWTSFPASPQRLAALWNSALAHERQQQWSLALDRLTAYLRERDEPDAQLHAAVAEYNLGRKAEAAQRLQAVSARPGLDVRRKAEALIQEGVIRVETGSRTDGAVLLRRAVEGLDANTSERIEPSLAAQAEFWLGEAYRGDFRDVTLDPSRMDEQQLKDTLEAKAQHLLTAQGHYLRCVRRGDAEWATAAGYRIGELYEEMHHALVDAPRPVGLTAEQTKVYDDELRKKVKNLLEKAIRAYDETLLVSERTGAKTEYVDRARASLERLRTALLGTN